MCLAVPMKVVRAGENQAWCLDRDGLEVSVDTMLTGPALPGQWLMVFLGASREVVDEAHAAQVLSAVNALEAALGGNNDAIELAFADLINREPQLPDFLRKDLP